ncbi:ergothioneine biosynthesis glutamate--cysteine ligase EgtA [Nocardioides perillae]|uniref:Glutamate--cysteine ligase EgtA n=1 Tax=Nocardioides perillae TaxID=1119534 RepID=A0A7Y9RUX9_9ACTN|nr:ergothioneine biosynthesis glutamate--cysteine ligase EgtA [Nocardioides perillae]NYG54564.1 glutamate--cysteine ligase [Nocardioides perillae]
MPPGASSVLRPARDDVPAAGLDAAAVHGWSARVCFKTGPPRLVGAELEWLVARRDDPTLPVPLPHLRAVCEAAGPPPRGSRVTFEPGGQVELSSLAHLGPSACWHALAEDAAHLHRAVTDAGLRLLPTGLDPWRAPHRQLQHPRYDAMAGYFAAVGGATAELGPVMMTGTASTQVNLDVGRDAPDAARRWHLLHTVGPALVAAFANSPRHAGHSTGWVSGRQRVWQGLDPRRTSPVTTGAAGDPVREWADYVLDAPLMLSERAGDDWSAPAGLTLRGRLDEQAPTTTAELATHASTLFPPVRPRGWFEVRYLDAQPDGWWPVPVAVLSALLDDERAGEAAAEACTGAADWAAAARDGLGAPGLQVAALACLDAAVPALARLGEHDALADLVRAFRDRWTALGRCPADDPLEP